MAVLLVLQGSVRSETDQTDLECHSTWYVMPGTQLDLTATDDNSIILIANPCE
jgi:hypothetical protein